MTNQQVNSIRSAISECDRFISKESVRNSALRPADVAELLRWYIAHRAKLVAMVESAREDKRQ